MCPPILTAWKVARIAFHLNYNIFNSSQYPRIVERNHNISIVGGDSIGTFKRKEILVKFLSGKVTAAVYKKPD